MGINFSEKLEFIIVTIIFTCCSLFGWISLILNPSILNNLFKRVDPGAGLLPVIILAFISLSSLYFFLKTINIVLDKQNYNKLIIYERSNFMVDVDIMCSVPNQSFFTELHPSEGTTERGGNKPQGFTDIK